MRWPTLALLHVPLALVGCLRDPTVYSCSSPSQCVHGATQGRCVSGYCAFADPMCGSGYRWDQTAAAGKAGVCVGAALEASTLESSGEHRSPDAAADASCATPGWTVYSLGALPLTDVWGSGPNDVWIVSDTQDVFHWTGGPTWVRSAVNPGGCLYSLYGICGTSATDVWAAGEGGVVWHYDGSAWGSAASHATGPLRDVWAASASDAWAIGFTGVIHWNGSTWSPVALNLGGGALDAGSVGTFNGIGGFSATNVWIAGGGCGAPGALLHWDGSVWTATHTALPMFDVWLADATDAWVATEGMAVDYTPSGPGATASNPDYVNGLWGSSATDLWMVSASGISHYSGGVTTVVKPCTSTTARQLNAVWGSGASDVWFVGNGGLVLHFTG